MGRRMHLSVVYSNIILMLDSFKTGLENVKNHNQSCNVHTFLHLHVTQVKIKFRFPFDALGCYYTDNVSSCRHETHTVESS